MDFSLVIPVYNGEPVLGETLDAARRCLPAPHEIIVVDDGSTDGTKDVAAAYDVTLVELDGPLGPATARTRGAEVASAEIVVFTDADVIVPEDLFTRLKQDFEETDAAVVQGIFSRVCPFVNFCSHYKNLYNRFVLRSLPDWIDTTFTSLTAVRRDVFLACGGFDCDIRDASVEDRTLGRNVIRAGGRIFLDREIEVIHNKRLTLRDFVRNQFRRSRDLAKLLLRNRAEKRQDEETPATFEKGRFGTNAPTTMARIPIAYLALGSLLTALFGYLWAWWLFAACLLAFLGLAMPFIRHLANEQGWSFALLGIPLNFVDALVSGAGILRGVFDYIVLKRRY